MTQRSETIVEVKTEEPEPDPKPDLGVPIGRALRTVTPIDYASTYSSDKSLLRSFVYGGDVNEFTKQVSQLADALLLDKSFNHDWLIDNRSEQYVRDIFTSRNGEFIDPVSAIIGLKGESIRLADGLELRAKHPELGVHTFNNLQTARLILTDIDKFFKESCDGYREYRTLRSGPIHFW